MAMEASFRERRQESLAKKRVFRVCDLIKKTIVVQKGQVLGTAWNPERLAHFSISYDIPVRPSQRIDLSTSLSQPLFIKSPLATTQFRVNEVEEDNPVKTRKSRRIGSNVVESDWDDFMAYGSPTSKAKGKLVRKKRTVQPGCGVIQDVDELGVTDDEGDDVALRSHRKICDKCRRGPSHELLQKHRKLKKGRKSKTRGEFEISVTENFESLGGWVRCLKCCVVAHWKCVATDQRDQIIFASQAQGDQHRETTDFLCNHCSNGGICIDCKEPAIAPELLAKLRPGVANAEVKVKEGREAQDEPMDIVKEESKEANKAVISGGGKDDPTAMDDSNNDADAMEVAGEL
ncbi:hypothetical protein SISNIDRAFT_489260 [Sistotremastrum niveocremeum HHB9708]|uniref:Uncharacterized protein n=1 Tax=Sistotremastrum niveocremeum HHB9708 TaxID=1314777 RepID=A0A164Q381_9AGAM|nr:hypothetical protein SISNIDRAFT_489260 [Sistotremastrum niveocremeum HHB9708]